MARRSRLADRRHELGRTVANVAREVGVVRKTVHRWEAGTTDPYQRQLPAIARAYDWPLDRIEVLLLRDGEVLDPGSFDDVDRRGFLGGGVALTLGAAVAPTQVFAAPRDVSPELPTYFAAQLADHYTADIQLGPRPVLATVTTEYGLIRQAADAARPNLRGDLMNVAFGYAELAGWLHQDMGDLDGSHRWNREALELAHRSGDPNLVAFALARMAFMHVDAGRAPDAVDLADAALATPSITGSARLYALSRAAQARSLAGDHDGTDRALDDYAALADANDDTPHWAPRSLMVQDAQRAICYGRLHRNGEAIDLWSGILDQHPPGAQRDRGMALARCSTALLNVEGPDTALAPATEALDCLQAAPSARMAGELGQLRDQAAHRLNSPAGRDLYDVLQAVA